MTIIRVFPRLTKATPDDSLVYIGAPDLFATTLQAEEVHISVAFTWDIPLAYQLAEAWQHIAPVRIGGPALGMKGEEFTPGMYLRRGYVITSRGCPNRCWFCSVWRREGKTIREIPIVDGWNVQDDNLLACSEQHIRAVFSMLARQTKRVQFTGGLEAAKLKQWHIDLLVDLKPEQIFLAYDTPDDLEPLQVAGQMLLKAGFTRRVLRSYVLIGWPKDTFEQAEKRLHQTYKAGFMPMAMLWRNEHGNRSLDWMRFQRQWARPAIIASRMTVTE